MFRLVLALALLHTVAGQCNRPGDQYIGDLCYTVSNLKLSYLDAASACYQNNENLAVLHNTFQANFLATLLRSNSSSGQFWIGLSRASLGSRFQWDDGTTMLWSNFDSSLPKNQLYVAESTFNGKWQTLDGQQALYFACSYKPGNVNPTDYPSNSTDYPVSYPSGNSTGYPVSWPAANGTDAPVSYPAGNGTDSPVFPASRTPGYPVSDSTGYPVSYPAGNGTDSPVFPASRTPGYPASRTPGYPASRTPGYPASRTPGYPASRTPGYPASRTPGYPGSRQYPNPTGSPVSVPANGNTGAPVSYPASRQYQDSTGSPASRPYRTVRI